MLKKDDLLASMSKSFDFLSSKAVFNELVSTFNLKDKKELDKDEVGKIAAYLAENYPSAEKLISSLGDAPAADAAPAVEPPKKEEKPAKEEKPRTPHFGKTSDIVEKATSRPTRNR